MFYEQKNYKVSAYHKAYDKQKIHSRYFFSSYLIHGSWFSENYFTVRYSSN